MLSFLKRKFLVFRSLHKKFDEELRPANALEVLILDAYENPEKRDDFYVKFLNYEVLVMVKKIGPSIDAEEVKLVIRELGENESFAYVFSSEKTASICATRLQIPNHELQLLPMKANLFFECVLNQPHSLCVALNPGSHLGVEFDNQMVVEAYKVWKKNSKLTCSDHIKREISLPHSKQLFSD